MTHKTLSLRLPLGLYEQLEREAIERKMSVAVVIVERLERSVQAIGFQLPEFLDETGARWERPALK